MHDRDFVRSLFVIIFVPNATLATLCTGGGTYLWSGLELVLSQLDAARCRNDYAAGERTAAVIVLSDGQTGGPQGDETVARFAAARQSLGATLTVHSIGFTNGCDTVLLQRITDAGDAVGLFYFIQVANV